MKSGRPRAEGERGGSRLGKVGETDGFEDSGLALQPTARKKAVLARHLERLAVTQVGFAPASPHTRGARRPARAEHRAQSDGVRYCGEVWALCVQRRLAPRPQRRRLVRSMELGHVERVHREEESVGHRACRLYAAGG